MENNKKRYGTYDNKSRHIGGLGIEKQRIPAEHLEFILRSKISFYIIKYIKGKMSENLEDLKI